MGEGKGRREEKGREGGREGIRQVSRPTGGLRGKGVIPDVALLQCKKK